MLRYLPKDSSNNLFNTLFPFWVGIKIESMIHKKEHRIGNLVMYSKEASVKPEFIGTVHEINPNDLNYNWETYYDPIPLTPELLVKCGFKSDDMADLGSYIFYIIEHPFLYLSFNDGSIWIGEVDTKCKSLHQLQNLIFALTQTELILTP